MASPISRPPTSDPASTRGVAVERLSDRALAGRAAGDEAAFAELVQRYREPLRRHAARYVGEGDAEDVVQQALVSASLALRKDSAREIEPRPWLYRVTTNAAIDHQRARAVRPLGDRVDDEPELERTAAQSTSEPHEVVESRDAIRALVTRMRALAPNQRRAATARFLEGRSHDEIGEELGISSGAARELIHRARSNLREAIPALSPLPLLARWRDAFAGLLPGSVPAAKLAVGAAVVAVAAGGGAALYASQDSGPPTVAAEEATAPVASVAEPPQVAERAHPGGGGSRAAGDGGGKHGAGAGADGSGDRQGGPGTTAGQQTSPAGTGDPDASGAASPGPVQELADQLGVGGLAEELGVGKVIDGLTAPNTGDAVEVPALPDVEAPGAPQLDGALGGS